MCKITVKEKADATITINTSSLGKCTCVLNTNTKKFHISFCSSLNDMKDQNKKVVTCSREKVIADGYQPCKRCNP